MKDFLGRIWAGLKAQAVELWSYVKGNYKKGVTIYVYVIGFAAGAILVGTNVRFALGFIICLGAYIGAYYVKKACDN